MYGKKDPSVRVSPPPASSLDLSGKSLVIVGGTAGVGRALALFAARRGAAVTVVGRSFKDPFAANLTFVKKDLSLMSEAADLGRSLPPADVVVLTTGILPPKERQATPEGFERDMAVSTLSRLVCLRELLPRLRPNARVFIYGMPGNGAVPKMTKLEDLNSEKGYSGGFGWTHINTVAGAPGCVFSGGRCRVVLFSRCAALHWPTPPPAAGNEAMAIHLAELERAKGPGKGAAVFGMNPGLVRSHSCSAGGLRSLCSPVQPSARARPASRGGEKARAQPDSPLAESASRRCGRRPSSLAPLSAQDGHPRRGGHLARVARRVPHRPLQPVPRGLRRPHRVPALRPRAGQAQRGNVRAGGRGHPAKRGVPRSKREGEGQGVVRRDGGAAGGEGGAAGAAGVGGGGPLMGEQKKGGPAAGSCRRIDG